ncbi:M4 family metallopeptidase, partial [Candidatus Latescibacterota bacterium]
LPGGPIRDMEDPGRFGLPSHMDEYRELPLGTDNGGVHVNMSIPARAFVLAVESIGRKKAAKIWYDVLDKRYLTPQSGFIDMRLGAVQAAIDLYGTESTEVASVNAAFDGVGIIGDTPIRPPVDVKPLEGDKNVVFVFDNYLVLAPPVIKDDDDLILPTETMVSTDSSNPIAVSKDGTFLLFVDIDYNLRYLDLETYEETLLDDTGDWSSIALSPDNNRLALTTIYEENIIYILDFDDTNNSKAMTLYTASTEGAPSNTVVFADALDWNMNGTSLLYDAMHRLPIVGDDPIEFWDINLIDIETEIITRIKTPTDSGIQVGNPAFAETTDCYIVCDLFSIELGINKMVTIDLFNLEINELRDNGAFPSKTGVTFTEPVELRDVFPTCLDAAGGTVPGNIDGKSVLDLFRGKRDSWREAIDFEHDVCYSPTNHWNALTDGIYKYIYHAPEGEEQLFDLKNDPGELRDLAKVSKYRNRISEWRGRMIDHFRERGEPFVVNGDLAPRPKRMLYSPHYPKDIRLVHAVKRP